MVTFDDAMLKPAACFRDPQEVLAQRWTTEQKFKVLRQWKYDIGQLHLATEENMQPGGQPRADPVTLGQVHEAIEELGYATNADPAPSKGA